jgi:hypothetical protein
VDRLERLRGLLEGLSAARPSGRQLLLRWLWTILQGAVAASFLVAMSYAHAPSYNQTITWQDIRTFDGPGRALLSLSYTGLVAGLYIAASFAYLMTGLARAGVIARLWPPPTMAPTLRQAIRARDSRIAPVAPVEEPLDLGLSGAGARPDSQLIVSPPEPLTSSLRYGIAALAGGVILLLLAAYSVLAFPSHFDAPIPDDTSLSLTGVFLTVSALTIRFAWRTWNSWRGRGRGVAVTPGAEGLTVRGPQTLYGRRFIPWRNARSLTRIAYRDEHSRTHTIYMLDAGAQTLLWESPPDMGRASRSRQAKIAQRQASAARLAALAATITSLPLLDISEVADVIASVEPDFASNMTIIPVEGEGIGGIEAPKTDEDVVLLNFLSSIAAEAPSADPAPPLTAGARLEQLRRLLAGLLMAFVPVAAAYYLFFWTSMLQY